MRLFGAGAAAAQPRVVDLGGGIHMAAAQQIGGNEIMDALMAFGAPMSEITPGDFSRSGVVFQIGVPPGRIDILTELTGLTFAEAWPDRGAGSFGDVTVASGVPA